MTGLADVPVLSTVRANDNGSPVSPEHYRLKSLTKEQQQVYVRARDKVFAVNPDLKKQFENMKSQLKANHDSGAEATPERMQAMRTQRTALEDQLYAEMIKVDPHVAPVIQQLKVKRDEWKSMPQCPATTMH